MYYSDITEGTNIIIDMSTYANQYRILESKGKFYPQMNIGRWDYFYISDPSAFNQQIAVFFVSKSKAIDYLDRITCQKEKEDIIHNYP